MSVEPSTSNNLAAAKEEARMVQARLMSLPNLLSGIRLVGSFGLAILAFGGNSQVFAIVFVLLAMTDWVDGRIARWLDQRTQWGPRLDSLADAALFGALLLGCLMMKGDLLLAEWGWLAAALLSYAVTSGAGLWKFGRVPAYHTWAAKTAWYTVLIAAVFVFFDGSAWPFRIATLAVTATNVEATLITLTLPQWQTDVPSLVHARQIRHASEANDARAGEPMNCQ